MTTTSTLFLYPFSATATRSRSGGGIYPFQQAGAKAKPGVQCSFYPLRDQFDIQWKQPFRIWNGNALRIIRRAKLISFNEIMLLMGMLVASPPEDEPGAVPIDVANLIRQAQQGDRDAVATLYQIYVRRIYRYIDCRVTSSSDAEDLTAEVFVRMVEALPTYQITGAPFEAWLYRIATSRVSDFYRSKGRAQVEELRENLPDDTTAYEETLVERQAVDALRQALRRLPEEHQSILILRFVERKSHEEVAALLGKSATAVKSIQHRALSRLTQLLGGDQKVRHYLRGEHE